MLPQAVINWHKQGCTLGWNLLRPQHWMVCRPPRS